MPAAGSPTVLGGSLLPGTLLLDAAGKPASADARALALLGCGDVAALACRWADVAPLLATAGLRLQPHGAGAARPERQGPPADQAGWPHADDGTSCVVELPPAAAAAPPGAAQRLRASLVQLCPANGSAGPAATLLLLADADRGAAVESDLRAASQMRSLAQIAPSVAHDLRAPINAMSLNLELLKETLDAATGPAGVPASVAARDPGARRQRYVGVVRDELARLHQSLELYIAHIAAGSDRLEVLDLRDAARDMAALLRPPARKQIVGVELLAPDAPVPVLAQRSMLRQALLHLGLAVLASAQRQGVVEIRLERPLPGRAHLVIAAAPLPGGGASAAADARAGAPLTAPPALSFSAGGTEARMAVAQAALASFGASVQWVRGDAAGGPAAAVDRPLEGHGTAGPDAAAVVEIDWPLSEAN